MKLACRTGVVAGRWFSTRGVALVALAFFVEMASGCLSNEYRIPSDELQRLAQTPPATRGHHVHVVEALGDRRSDAIPFHAPPPPPPEVPPPGPESAGPSPGGLDEPIAEPIVEPILEPILEPSVDDDAPDDDINAHVDLSIDGSGSGRPAHASPMRGRFVADGAHGNPPPGGGLRGSPPQPGLHGNPPSGGWRGSPPSGAGSRGGHVGGGGGHGIGHIGGLGGGGSSSGGGGGGGGGDALAVIAVVLVVVAVVAGISLVASEGMRFDGYAEIAPDQSIHLKDDHGRSTTVALADLTPADVEIASEAIVKDDEESGLGLGSRAPLDRRGLAFKVELGSSNFNLGVQRIAGMASQIQVGAFFTRKAGVMLDIGLSGGSVCCSGLLSRHSLALEAQVFPWSLGPLHVGVFGKGGVAIASDSVNTESGPIFGGGALVELALTTRLALAFRAGANAAHLDSGWSTAGTLTGGVSIY